MRTVKPICTGGTPSITLYFVDACLAAVGVMRRWDNVRVLGALTCWREAVERLHQQRASARAALALWTRQSLVKVCSGQ